MNIGAGTSNSSYGDDVQNIFNGLSVSLRVLVWGPGETNRTKWVEKRTEVIRAIADASKGADTVVASEELFRHNPPPPIELGYAELVHAEKADVIIALVMASPDQQGGVYRELEIIAPHRYLREKVWIFLPDVRSYLRRFQAGMLSVYRDDHKISLSWDMLETCQRLRGICVSKVNEERKQRMYDKLFARMHSRGQPTP